jgi:hypothetical protein
MQINNNMHTQSQVPLSASTPLVLAISYMFLMIDNDTALAEGGAYMKERKKQERLC